MNKIPLGLYAGALFLLVFVVAPILLREKHSKNLAGRFYGKILWRFYPLAFFLILSYLISDANKLYALLLMSGLGANIITSYYLKKLKKSLGDIDLLPFDHPKRSFFRKVSMFSTLLLFINFLLSLYILVKQ
jgi:hypothetical protein